MRFRVLGPLEVTGDDGPITLGDADLEPQPDDGGPEGAFAVTIVPDDLRIPGVPRREIEYFAGRFTLSLQDGSWRLHQDPPTGDTYTTSGSYTISGNTITLMDQDDPLLFRENVVRRVGGGRNVAVLRERGLGRDQGVCASGCGSGLDDGRLRVTTLAAGHLNGHQIAICLGERCLRSRRSLVTSCQPCSMAVA